MIILGLNAYHGDSAACIVVDGKLIFAIEEERIRRVKHWAGFPIESIKACLNAAKINISDVDHIGISRNPSAHLHKKLLFSLKKIPSLSSIKDRLSNASKIGDIKNTLSNEFGIEFSQIHAKVHNIEHHRAHLASSFFVTEFEEAALISVDGFGDFASAMTGAGSGNSFEVFDFVEFPHSMGIYYTAMTQFLGFPYYGDEYKVMGLAPYGKPIYMNELQKIVKKTKNGLFELNLDYFTHHSEGVDMVWDGGVPHIGRLYSDKLEGLLGKSREKGEPITQYHKDLASTIQRVYEEVFFHMLDHLYEKTKLEAVCISGGCAQNSVANGKIFRNSKFKKAYIPPAGYDAGTAIGAAFFIWNQILREKRTEIMNHGYWGTSYSNDEIEALLSDRQVKYLKLTDEIIAEKTAIAINEGKVIGWFQGAMEWGPRALGNRSILGDPRRLDMKDILNLKIKRRESFRPFAPSILEEYVSEYFEESEPVPFMEKVYQIKEEKRESLLAVTHVDGSGRLQSVSKLTNPKYWQLIEAFRQITGVPVLLNTSFNENEPIVHKPEEALDTYLRTQMDVLVLGNFYLSRT